MTVGLGRSDAADLQKLGDGGRPAGDQVDQGGVVEHHVGGDVGCPGGCRAVLAERSHNRVVWQRGTGGLSADGGDPAGPLGTSDGAVQAGDRRLQVGKPHRRLPGRGARTEGALSRPGAEEAVFGPAQRHVQEATLLGASLGVAGMGDRDQTVFQTGHMDVRPLESLGGVEAGDIYGVGCLVGHLPSLGAGPGQEAPTRSTRVEGQELIGHPVEFGECQLPVGAAPGCVLRSVSWLGRVLEGAQVRHAVGQGLVAASQGGQLCLHVGTVQQATAGPGPGGYGGRPERCHHGFDLGVGPDEDGVVRPSAIGPPDVSDPAGDPGCLGFVVGVLLYDRIGARVPIGQHRVLSDEHRGGRAQDLGGAPVVLPQFDLGGARKVGGEAVQVVGVGAVPAVDGLVLVTDHAEVGSTVQPGVQELELQRVHVLELVDVEVAEPPALGVCEPTVGGHGATALVEQVVEVDHPTRRLHLLVVLEDPGDGRWGEGWPAVGRLGGVRVGLRPYVSGPGPFDLADHVQRCGGPVVPGQQGSDHPHLADQQFGLTDVVLTPPGAQLGIGHRVEGARSHLVAHPDPPQPTAHLGCRLAGERQGQDTTGVVPTGERTPGDPVCQDPCLSRPGSRMDGQRHGVGGHRLALLVVEAPEQRVGVGVVRGGAEEAAPVAFRDFRLIPGSIRHAHRAHPSDGP